MSLMEEAPAPRSPPAQPPDTIRPTSQLHTQAPDTETPEARENLSVWIDVNNCRYRHSALDPMSLPEDEGLFLAAHLHEVA